MSPRPPTPGVPPEGDPESTPRPRPLRFGYGTNGLADLRLDDALTLLADLGYDGVGLTLDHMHLDPLAPDVATRTRRVAQRLDALGLDVTVETGARYVLDPRRKHGPSLLDPDPADRARRADLLIRAVRIAGDLGAHAVHCFSGTLPPGTDRDTAWKRLAQTLAPVLEAAAAAGIPLAVEPEPGHLLATLADFHHLRLLLGDPEPLGLTLDIGHCQCLEPLSPADCVRAAAPWLRHVQIEDMRRGVHEHLPFGDGEIDFPPVLAALRATGYQGLTVVELPRHSHAGPRQAELSLPFLHRAAAPAPPDGRTTAPDGFGHRATALAAAARWAEVQAPDGRATAPDGVGHRGIAPEEVARRAEAQAPDGLTTAPDGFGHRGIALGADAHRTEVQAPDGRATAPDGVGHRGIAPEEVAHRTEVQAPDGRATAPDGVGHRGIAPEEVAHRTEVQAPDGLTTAPDGFGHRGIALAAAAHRTEVQAPDGRATAPDGFGHRAAASEEVAHRTEAQAPDGLTTAPDGFGHRVAAPEEDAHRAEHQASRPTHLPSLPSSPPPTPSPAPPGEPSATQEGSTP